MSIASKGIINGPLLDASQWLMSVTTVHPSIHRLKNALGLTIGMFGGRYLMDRMVGETPDGDKVDPEDSFFFMRPLHGTLAYNHYSDATSDRLKHLVDLWTPAALGAAGAVIGSHDFALTQPLVLDARKAMMNAESLTLNKAEDAAIMLQGKVWRFLAGATSIFGSSSNVQLLPGPWNYGSTLGGSFLGTVRRNKVASPYFPGLQKFMNANNHPYPFGPSSMLHKLKDYLVHNPDPAPVQTEAMARAVLEPWFGSRVTQEHVDAFLKPLLEARGKVYQAGGVPEAARGALEQTLKGFMLDKGLEKHLMGIGLNPAEAMIGRNGFVERLSRMLGGEKILQNVDETFRKGLMARHGLKELPAMSEAAAKNAATLAADKAMFLKGSAALSAMALGVLALGYHSVTQKEDPYQPEKSAGSSGKKEPSAQVAASSVAARAPAVHTRKEEHAAGIGETLLSGIERVTDGLNAATSMSLHRTSCALGLTIGGAVGMLVGDTVAGRTLTGQAITEEKIPSFMKGLYKKVSYNPHSDHPKDRWGYVLHFALPAVFAAAGVIAASDLFFRGRKKQVNKQADYIEDYENRATMTEANAWTPLVAATAPVVTPSGFSFLPPPFPNYGASLGTRFMLAAGRKGVMPGVAEFWTGATSRYALGPVKLRDHMIQYAINNPDEHPKQLEEMARGIVRQWFPDATPAQIHEFVHRVEQDRDRFFSPGAGIPQEMKEQCEELLEKHFKGAGLERTLREIGLDPTHAVLGSNGIAATIAKALGASEELEDIHNEYRAKYTSRLKSEQSKPQDPSYTTAI